MAADAADAAADDAAAEGIEVRRIQPYEARKAYACPGCNQEIGPGVGHLVVVPTDAPDLRRHWHHPCWSHRATRRPGRAQARRAR